MFLRFFVPCLRFFVPCHIHLSIPPAFRFEFSTQNISRIFIVVCSGFDLPAKADIRLLGFIFGDRIVNAESYGSIKELGEQKKKEYTVIVARIVYVKLSKRGFFFQC